MCNLHVIINACIWPVKSPVAEIKSTPFALSNARLLYFHRHGKDCNQYKTLEQSWQARFSTLIKGQSHNSPSKTEKAGVDNLDIKAKI